MPKLSSVSLATVQRNQKAFARKLIFRLISSFQKNKLRVKVCQRHSGFSFLYQINLRINTWEAMKVIFINQLTSKSVGTRASSTSILLSLPHWLHFFDAFSLGGNKFNDFIKFVGGCSASCYIWELNYDLFSKFQLKLFYGNYANDHQSCGVFKRNVVEVMKKFPEVKWNNFV